MRLKILVSISIVFIIAIIFIGIKSHKQNIFSELNFSKLGFIQNINDIEKVYKENKILKRDLSNSNQLKNDIKILENENSSLNSLKQTKNLLSNYNPTAVAVIGRDSNTWFDSITINKGKKDGIKNNMAVVSPQGFIGYIQNVNNSTSTVSLMSATNLKNKISASIKGNRNIAGLISGYNKQNNTLMLTGLPINLKIKIGDTVVTSGLGNYYPQGLKIGEVEKIELDPYGLTRTAYIKAPQFDFLNYVLVLLM